MVATVAGAEVDVARIVDPERIGALVAVAVALEHQRHPGAGETVDAKTRFDGHRSGQVERRVARPLGAAVAAQRQRLAVRRRDVQRLQAARSADRDGARIDAHPVDGQGVAAGVVAVVIEALDHQRVAPGEVEPGGAEVLQVTAVSHLAPERVDQPDVGAVIGVRRCLHVDVDLISGERVEAVDLRLATRRKHARNHVAIGDHGLVLLVQDAKAVAAGVVAGDRQDVVAGGEFDARRPAVVGCVGVDAALADEAAARAGQAPVEAGTAADVIEIDPRRRRDREAVAVVLRAAAAVGADGVIQIDRHWHLCGRARDLEAVVGSSGVAQTAFDQKQVPAGLGQRAAGEVAEVVVADSLPGRTDQMPGRVVVLQRGQRDLVEEQLLAGKRVEAEDRAAVGRVERTADDGVDVDRRGARRRMQLEGKTAGDPRGGPDVDHVRAGEQAHQRVAVVIAVGVVEAAAAVLDALRPGGVPVEAGIAAERIHEDPLRIGDLEAEAAVLAGSVDRAGHQVADQDIGHAVHGGACKSEGVALRSARPRITADAEQISAAAREADAIVTAGVFGSEHQIAVRVDQELTTTPCAGNRKIGHLAGARVDGEELQRVARIEGSADGGVERNRGRGSLGVDQAEIKALVGTAVDRQRVVAGQQMQRRQQAVTRITAVGRIEIAVVHLDPARAGERPVQAVLVPAQGVEHQQAVGRKAEVEHHRRRTRVQHPRDLGAHGNRAAAGQGVAAVVGQVVQKHGVAAVGVAADIAFDQQRVVSTELEPGTVGRRSGGADDAAPERVEHTVGDVAVARHVTEIEIDLVARKRVKAIDRRLATALPDVDGERAAFGGRCSCGHIHQPKSIAAGEVRARIDQQRVVPGRQVDQVAAVVPAVRIGEAVARKP